MNTRWLVAIIVVVLAVVAVLNLGAIRKFFSSGDTDSVKDSRPVAGTPKKDGLALFREGRYEEAGRLLESEIAAPGTKDAGRRCDALGDCRSKSGNKMAAWYFYSLALAQPDLRGDARAQVVKKASALGSELVFDTQVNPQNEAISVQHIVQAGDSLEKIAKKTGTTSGFIQRINNIRNPNMIRANSILRCVKGSFSKITVDKSDFILTAYFIDPDGREYFFKQYPVSTGQPGKETPVGTFTVGAKLIEPTWPDPAEKGKYRPYGDPLNPLGTRWMGFAEQGYTDLGVHGTIDEKSIGQKVTNGCVRMYNKDVEELYDLVLSGAKVIIQE